MVKRRKNSDTAKLPKYVYRGKSKYEYRPEKGVCIKLCRVDAPLSELWAKYEALVDARQTNTVRKLIEQFLAHPDVLDKPANTLADYRQSAKRLMTVFDSTHPDTLTPPHIRKYMDVRGSTSKVRANRELSFLSVVYAFAVERGLAQRNPCAGVKKYTEKSRDRLIQDWEYMAVYNIAPPAVQVAMELSYLCAMRQGDVLKLSYEDCKTDGIYVKQGKTGKAQIKAWTPRLRAAIDASKELKRRESGPQVFSRWVVSNKSGARYTRSGFGSIWQAVMADALAHEIIKERFTFHDLKAKSISDYQGDKQKFSGHKTAAQVGIYNRTVEIVDTISDDHSRNNPGKRKEGN